MSTQPLKKAAVLGAGSMGHGIAQLLIMTGTDVNLVDINDEILVTGKKSGYYFDAAPEGGNERFGFTATAVPIIFIGTSATGRQSYYGDQTNVIRTKPSDDGNAPDTSNPPLR